MPPPKFLPLEDLRILDLSSDICGPYTTKLFADAGAEVIKIEDSEGDSMRSRSLFHFLNTSKKSLVLNLAESRDREELFKLLPGVDMLVEDFPPGTMEELGLSVEALQSHNPQLVVVSISPWGNSGPFSQYPANEFTLQSWAGATASRGIPEEVPYGVGGQLGDFMTASCAAAGALGAVMSARKTGKGSHIDVSKYEAITTSFVTYHHIIAAFDREGKMSSGRSIEIPSIEPTSDGWVGFCTITGQQFQDFCVLIGDPEMGDDERFTNFNARMDSREEAWERISKYTTHHTTDEIVEQASLLRIPVSPVNNGETVLSNDHFTEREIYVKNPAGFSQPRIPFQFEKGTMRDFEPAPRLGEHNDLRGDNELNQAKTNQTKEKDTKKRAGTQKNAKVSQVLNGIRVCDLSAFWAGPLVGSFLGSLGADVIKVESPKRPDGMRFAGSMGQEKTWEWSPVFHGANCNKRDLTLDILTIEGRQVLRKLISSSDIVLENYSPRVMENWALTWDTIKQLNPNAIMLRMPAFGLTGPWRDRTGFAMTIEQASGLAFRTGDLDGRPMVPRGVCDPMGAMHSVFAVLMALKHREETGEGQLIEVPLVEVGLNAAAEQVVEWSANQKLLQRMGNRSPEIAPQGVYPCRGDDDWICISMDKDELWEGLANLIGNKELGMDDSLRDLINDESLKTLSSRKKAHDQIDEAVSIWTKTQDLDSATDSLAALGIPAAPVIPGIASADHPQHLARGFHQILNHAVAGDVPYTSFPFQIDGEFLEFKTPAPSLGEHNEEVLSEVLGISDDEIKALAEKGIIGTEPNFG